ncbi:MAG: CHAT domain-containing protein [Bacteroidota bacterium]
MKISSLSIVLLLLFGSGAKSQIVNKADSLFKMRQWDSCIYFYKQQMVLDPPIEKRVYCKFQLGKAYFEKQNFSLAEDYLTDALQEAKKNQLPEDKIAEIDFQLSYVYMKLWKNELSLSHANAALKILEKLEMINPLLGESYRMLGILMGRKGDFDQSLLFYNKAIKIQRSGASREEQLGLASTLIDIGVLYTFVKVDYEKAEGHFKEALIIQQNNLPSEDPAFAYTYSHLGRLYYQQGKWEQALPYQKFALIVLLESLGEDHLDVGFCYDNLGKTYTKLRKLSQGEQSLKKSVSIYEKNSGFNTIKVARRIQSLGVNYREQKKYALALKCFKRAYRIHDQLFKSMRADMAVLLYEIGLVYQNQKKFEEAIKYYEKASIAQARIFGKSHPTLLDNYNRIGFCFLNMGNYELAIASFTKSIDLNIHLNDTTVNPSEVHISNMHLLESTVGLGETYLERYKKIKDKDFLFLAEEVLLKADTIVDQLYKVRTVEKDRVKLSEISTGLYEKIIQNYVSLSRTQDSYKYLEKAFDFVEKSKGKTFRLKVSENLSRRKADIPEVFIHKEKILIQLRSESMSDLYKADSSKDNLMTKTALLKLVEIDLQLDSLKTYVQSDHPKYYSSINQDRALSVSEIQRQLDHNDIVLQYFVGTDFASVFILKKDSLLVEQLGDLSEVGDQIALFNDQLRSKNLSTFKKVGRRLYQQLIVPAEKHFRKGNKIIIGPHNQLWHLSFELLPSINTLENTPKRLTYLLMHHQVSYTHSLSTLFMNDANDSNMTKEECLAFSYSDRDSVSTGETINFRDLRQQNSDLPGSRMEISTISKIIDGVYYYGNNANESNFKKSVNQYDIVHLALHGQIDQEEAFNSKLIFTKTDDQNNDDVLYFHELAELNIPAKLVILSACHTGEGKLALGEGTMNIGRAFRQAGAKSVLLSRWEVSDAVAPTLMKDFYVNLKKGFSKSESLRRAQLNYLQNAPAERSHPYYWGNFFILGDDSSVSINDSSSFKLYFIVSIALLISIAAFLIFRKKLNTRSQF